MLFDEGEEVLGQRAGSSRFRRHRYGDSHLTIGRGQPAASLFHDPLFHQL